MRGPAQLSDVVSHPRDDARNTKKKTLKRTTSSSRAHEAISLLRKASGEADVMFEIARVQGKHAAYLGGPVAGLARARVVTCEIGCLSLRIECCG
jgi:hypothetical protein